MRVHSAGTLLVGGAIGQDNEIIIILRCTFPSLLLSNVTDIVFPSFKMGHETSYDIDIALSLY